MAASLETPIVGAALTKRTLALQRDWILEKQRDLEIQDFFSSETLDGDWRSVGAEIRGLLDGYTGRLGIHGPFWGFKIDSQDPLIRSVVTRRLLQGLEACEMVGATQMVIHSPFTTWDYNNLDINPGSRHALIRAGPFDPQGGRAACRKHRLRTRHRKHRGQRPGCPRPARQEL